MAARPTTVTPASAPVIGFMTCVIATVAETSGFSGSS